MVQSVYSTAQPTGQSSYLIHIDGFSDVDPNAISSKYSMYMLANTGVNPYLFRSVPMVTTFVRSAGRRTKGVWSLLEKASRADIRLAEMEHSSLKKKHCHIIQGGFSFMCTSLFTSH